MCTVAAAIFALLTVMQGRALPDRRTALTDDAAEPATSILAQWRSVLANRPFLLFSAAMTGSYVLTFQVYLALPLAAGAFLGANATEVTSGLFVVSAAIAVVGQLRLTAWAKKRWSSHRALAVGLSLLGLAFVPLAFTPHGAPVMALAALVAAVVLLAVGGAISYPFEMETVVALCDNRLVATHYGLYNTVSGLGVTLGNLAVGAVWDFAQNHRMEWLTWGALVTTGLVCAASVVVLARTGILARRPLLEVRQA
ncbi:Major Facilitator Superfamily protein [Streptomyces sp. Ncost-T6T-2b]|nr:Major Facilitator Superfamily protein [Streptomyces sp. Ncost-T6T-2b]